MRRLIEQQCFTVFEVAADWHELVVPRRDMSSTL